VTPDDRLAHYADLLRAWAPRLDLVSQRDLDRLENRHIADSLRLGPLLDELPEGPCVDVGSGAGLPGIPLAILRSDRVWRLLEPRRRRAAFLEEAVRELALANCEVMALTAEQAVAGGLGRGHALATARALAPADRALDLVAPLVMGGGAAAVFVGESGRIPQQAVEWAPGIAILRIETKT
jgi:16S rRNA (guanine527-N7)-methyltransferase